MKQQENKILTVADVVRLIDYEKELGVFIFLNEDRYPPHIVIGLKKERNRVNSQLRKL